MPSTLIRHGDVLAAAGTSQPALRHDCTVVIDDGCVSSLGQDPPPGFEADEVVDASGCLLLPALFNAHCHAAMTLVRGWAEDLPFDRWLNERIWVAESALREQDVYWGAALAACEMLHCGVVGFADHYFWMEQVARVVEQAGMKALLAWCVFGGDTTAEVGQLGPDHALDFARNWNGACDGRIRTALGPHSPYMCPPDYLRVVADQSQQLQLPVHLHLAESQQQVAQSRTRHGCSPVQQLEQLGLLEGPGLLAAHCIAVDDDDIRLLARPGIHVAHTPKTYMKLAMGMPPLQRLWDAGVSVALGSDGPASNADFNLLETMRLVGLVQKLQQQDPEAAPVARLLQMATARGAAALGFGASGQIRPGASADLVLLDLRHPHYYPRHDPLAMVAYASHPSDVRHVWVDGKQLVREGQLLTLDEERIRHEAENRARSMVGQQRMGQLRAYTG